MKKICLVFSILLAAVLLLTACAPVVSRSKQEAPEG